MLQPPKLELVTSNNLNYKLPFEPELKCIFMLVKII